MPAQSLPAKSPMQTGPNTQVFAPSLGHVTQQNSSKDVMTGAVGAGEPVANVPHIPQFNNAPASVGPTPTSGSLLPSRPRPTGRLCSGMLLLCVSRTRQHLMQRWLHLNSEVCLLLPTPMLVTSTNTFLQRPARKEADDGKTSFTRSQFHASHSSVRG